MNTVTFVADEVTITEEENGKRVVIAVRKNNENGHNMNFVAVVPILNLEGPTATASVTLKR